VRYRFGPFVADRDAYQLCEGDRPLAVTPKLLDLLFYLLEHPATLVTKEELLDGVWPDANVTDNALAQAVSELRDVLGDAPASPAYIKTIARRGYRFIAPVEPVATATAPRQAVETPAAVPSSAEGQTIAVLDFENVTRAADVAWLGAGIAETVSNDLSALGCLKVIDRWRVLQASRVTGGELQTTAAALGASLVVTGSYQHRGPRLRITARVVDVDRSEPIADAKVDGAMDDVFGLQDEIVASFARDLGLRRTASTRPAPRETSNLEAYRAYIEGWLTIETLDTSLTPDAMAAFERAIRVDPSYAMAYTGLANTKFLTYEMTRVSRAPDFDALGSGIAHARRAVELDDQSAEAHATLSFLLVSAFEFEEARAAAKRAATLEPDNWRHQFRLGHASWGSARQRALERALRLFPQFPYTTFELALLHTARGQFDLAERAARQGAIEQDRQSRLGRRYPAIGFHWLVGTLESAAGQYDAAIRSFDRELALTDPHKLYGPEYAAWALVGRGFAELATGRPAAALVSFRQVHQHVEGLPRAYLGEVAAARALKKRTEVDRASTELVRSCENLRRTRRAHEALFVEASRAALDGDTAAAVAHLKAALDSLPPSQPGWMTPAEPAFAPLRNTAGFGEVLARLAERAR
jgi:DNA-binding winged helix-turn-helix (wHTH) protein/tetratricopeptide (TPR) repeat protein